MSQPNFIEFVSFFNKTVENASDLIKESKLLNDNSMFARSSYLAQIACEELAKAIIISTAAVNSRKGMTVNYKRFYQRIRDHKAKNDLILGLLTTLQSKNPEIDLKDMRPFSVELNNYKNATLYADYYTNLEKFTSPSEIIPTQDTEALIKIAEALYKIVQFYKIEYSID